MAKLVEKGFEDAEEFNRLKTLIKHLSDFSSKSKEKLKQGAKNHPLMSLGIAAVIGAGIGYLLGKKSNH